MKPPILNAWPDYVAPASNRRALARLMLAKEKGKLAFLLGAGVDMGLRREAGGKSPNWSELMEELAGAAGLAGGKRSGKKTAGELHRDWPTEMALIYRWILGEDSFREKLNRQFTAEAGPKVSKKKFPYARALGKLLAGSNLIITLNYSPFARDALRQAVAKGVQIVELDREDLPSFQIPAPAASPETIYFIHLHGRAEALSTPILDAWGYNVVQNEDGHYRQILRDLFEKRYVLSLGVSWSDVLLRSEAAYVKRTKGFSDVEHAMLKWHGSAKELDDYEPPGRRIVWSRAMKASYNLTVQPVNSAQQTELTELLSGRPPARPFHRGGVNLDAVQEFLDFHGDFESTAQHQCFGSSSRTRAINLRNVHTACLDHLRQGKDPVVVARIERHLRHHLWLYFKELPRAAGRYGTDARKVLYDGLLKAVASRHKATDSWPEELLLDFLFGLPEVLGSNRLLKSTAQLGPAYHGRRLDWGLAFEEFKLPPGEFDRMLERLRACPRTASRLNHVPWVWFKYKAIEPEQCRTDEQFIRNLINCGCDSLAAKAVLDVADRAARYCPPLTPGTRPGDWREELLLRLSSPWARKVRELASRAADLARAAGHRRREVKAHALQAMWSASPREGRLLILGDSLSQQSMNLEDPLQDGLSFSLIACHLAASAAASGGEPPGRMEFAHVIESAGFGKWTKASESNMQGYWRQRAPAAARVALSRCMKWKAALP